VLVNINKLKPYKFIEDITLQLVLIKPSDLVIDEHVQTKELEYFQPIEFEPVNHLIHGNIKIIYVLVDYYDVLVEDNNVIVCNDQNHAFSEALIDVYILEVYNPKGCIYS
jgi:hypothetical protein